MSDAALDDGEMLESLVGRLVDEFIDRRDRGESADVDEYARRHPEHADVIRDVLAALVLVRSAAPGPMESDCSPAEPVTGRLGDYRIVREIGRGGMGVVFEAEQVSLGRRVALKVLPFAAALDQRRLQRFKTEAHAAAQLHHTHIVPVYGVGIERGVHYYAMQFIDGRPLDRVIADWRRAAGRADDGAAEVDGPTESFARRGPADTPADAAGPTRASAPAPAHVRTAVRLALQAAEALDHAHQAGVVHRDVKPANLLVDGHGDLWVTDFGLAQVQSDARLTATGDWLGTLRYMSPEQTAGKPGLVDHRADVYALGATLYELLALEPAFPGTDRKQVLRRITFDEPVPPRKLNRAIPAELETVVLKALAKDPAERYPSARDVADDLKRFLEDKPVLARRPSLALRVRKWSRRHRAVLSAAAVAAVVVLAASTVVLWLEKRRADRNAAAARASQAVAEENFEMAFEAVDVFLTRVGDSPELSAHGLEPVRADLLASARDFLERFVSKRGHDPTMRKELADAYHRLGFVTALLGDREKAVELFARQEAICEQLLAEDPAEVQFQSRLANARMGLGRMYDQLGRPQDAAAKYLLALEGLRALERGVEGDRAAKCRSNRSICCSELGDVFTRLRSFAEAEHYFREAIALQRELDRDPPSAASPRWNLAATLNNLGKMLYEHTDRSGEAEEAIAEALGLWRGLARKHSTNPAYRDNVAQCLTNLAGLYKKTDRVAQATEAYREALPIRKALAEAHPAVPAYRSRLAETHFSAAEHYRSTKDHTSAETALRLAADTFGKLVEDYAGDDHYRFRLATARSSLGLVYSDMTRWKDAATEYEQARRVLEAPAFKHRDSQVCRAMLGSLHLDQGSNLVLESRRKEADPRVRQEAETHLQAGQKIFEGLVAEKPKSGTYHDGVGRACCWRGDLANERGAPKDALELFAKGARHLETALQLGHKDAVTRRLAGNAHHLRALILTALAERSEAANRLAEAAASYEEARRSWQSLLRHQSTPAHQGSLHRGGNQLGIIYRRLRRLDDARTVLEETEKGRQALADANPDRADFQTLLAGTRCNLGNVLQDQKQYPEAIEWYDRAIAALKGIAAGQRDPGPVQSYRRNCHVGKAEALAELGRHAEALAEWEQAIGQDDRKSTTLFLKRAAVRARLGDHRAAVREAEERTRPPAAASALLGAARVYALASSAAARDSTLSPAEREKLAESHAGRAVTLLGEALAKKLSDPGSLPDDPDLAPLHRRDDFKKLLSSTETKAK